jgi:hypothetical protein
MVKFMVVILSMPQWPATREDPTSKEVPFKTTLLNNLVENKHVQEMVCRKEEASNT